MLQFQSTVFLRVGKTFLIRPQQPCIETECRSDFLPAEHVHHSAVTKVMLFRSNYLHLTDISGMPILWEVTGGAAFSVRRSRQLDIRRCASSI